MKLPNLQKFKFKMKKPENGITEVVSVTLSLIEVLRHLQGAAMDVQTNLRVLEDSIGKNESFFEKSTQAIWHIHEAIHHWAKYGMDCARDQGTTLIRLSFSNTSKRSLVYKLLDECGHLPEFLAWDTEFNVAVVKNLGGLIDAKTADRALIDANILLKSSTL
jgi:hypothetical protein